MGLDRAQNFLALEGTTLNKTKKHFKCPQNFKNVNSTTFELFFVFVTTLIYLYNPLVFQDNPTTLQRKGENRILSVPITDVSFLENYGRGRTQ